MSTVPSTHKSALVDIPFFDRIARRIVLNNLSRIRSGAVALCDGRAEFSVGESAELQAQLRIRHPRFFHRALLGGTLAVAESYIEGDWDCDDLTTLFRI